MMMTQAGMDSRKNSNGNSSPSKAINLNEIYAVKRSDGNWRSAEVIQTRGTQVLISHKFSHTRNVSFYYLFALKVTLPVLHNINFCHLIIISNCVR